MPTGRSTNIGDSLQNGVVFKVIGRGRRPGYLSMPFTRRPQDGGPSSERARDRRAHQKLAQGEVGVSGRPPLPPERRRDPHERAALWVGPERDAEAATRVKGELLPRGPELGALGLGRRLFGELAQPLGDRPRPLPWIDIKALE
jgi:hypothetical protein